MIKKTLAAAAVAASVVGATGLAAAPAMAIGGDDESGGANTVNGNGSKQAYGNTTTGGYMSPNISLINGSLNKPCFPLPLDINIQDLAGGSTALQDILNSKAEQNCVENSTQVDGDDPLSHLLSDIPILSENGVSRH